MMRALLIAVPMLFLVGCGAHHTVLCADDGAEAVLQSGAVNGTLKGPFRLEVNRWGNEQTSINECRRTGNE